MRTIYIFVVGFLVGLTIHMAVAQDRSHGIVGLNHVAISVPNLEEAVTFYTETMGFPEAFRVSDASGKTALVYVQISKDTFVELQPAHAQRPPGINHFGVLVQDMAATTAALTDLGAAVGDTRVGSTKAILANVTDPNGIRIELLELPPESLTAEAIARWQ